MVFAHERCLRNQSSPPEDFLFWRVSWHGGFQVYFQGHWGENPWAKLVSKRAAGPVGPTCYLSVSCIQPNVEAPPLHSAACPAPATEADINLCWNKSCRGSSSTLAESLPFFWERRSCRRNIISKALQSI